MKRSRLDNLLIKNFLSWQGKAGSFAKSKNKILLELANQQKERYYKLIPNKYKYNE